MTKSIVTAVIATYNEEERILPVLDTLVRCSDVHEIIVVDDGSRSPVNVYASKYPTVRFLTHERNKGKAAAMETGVQAAKGEYIFFCDADLLGLQPEHVSGMIRPVLDGTYQTFIGIRFNPEQRAVKLFALNSGERCVKKSDWNALPQFYKTGFRIETGLNFRVKKSGGKMGYAVFPYRQTIKEKKWGFWRGLRQRWIMTKEVGVTYCYIVFYDFWKRTS